MDFFFRIFSFGAYRLEERMLGFFEPLGPKWKYSEEKIHLFYRIIKVQISGGLPTDYMLSSSKLAINCF